MRVARPIRLSLVERHRVGRLLATGHGRRFVRRPDGEGSYVDRPLSPTETTRARALDLMANGLTNKAVAKSLHIDARTVAKWRDAFRRASPGEGIDAVLLLRRGRPRTTGRLREQDARLVWKIQNHYMDAAVLSGVYSERRVARELGLSRRSVRSALARLGDRLASSVESPPRTGTCLAPARFDARYAWFSPPENRYRELGLDLRRFKG